MTARIIDGDRAGDVGRWSSPSIDESAADALKGAPGGTAHLLTAGQLEALQQQAHTEAYDRGFEQGLAEGRAEAAKRAARFDALIAALARPFDELDRAVEEDLNALAIAVASHLLRRELEVDGAALAAAVKDCLAALPAAARDVTIRLNPDDARLVAEHLTPEAGGRFRIEADPATKRGDLMASAQNSEIDGRLETRVATLLTAALGDAQ